MSQLRHSLAWSAASTYFSLTLQLISAAVISRLLTPAEIGVFSVAAVLATFATSIRDFGVGEYLIQQTELTQARIRAAIGVNVAISWTMAALLLSTSPLVAAFYRHDGVAAVMQVQSMSFVLVPFGAVAQAYLRRQLEFKPIFIANVTSGLMSFTTSLVMAWQGFGAVSLAWGSLAGVASSVLVSLILAPPGMPWRPGFAAWREVWNFGSWASTVYIFAQVGRAAPELIIGRLLDLASVALFSRAGGLVEIFNRAVMGVVMPVCLPYLSREGRMGHEMAAGYLRASALVTAIGWPFLAVLAVQAPTALSIMYGDQWVQVAPVARVLCVAGALELTHVLAKELLIACGRVKQASILQMTLIALRVSGLLGLAVAGPQGGLMAAAWGLLLTALLGQWISQRAVNQGAQISTGRWLLAHRDSALLAAAAALPQFLLLPWESTEPSRLAWLAPLSAAMAIGGWLAALRALKHPLLDELRRVMPARLLRKR